MKQKIFAELQAESVSNRRSMFHFKKLLRNGQIAHLWLFKKYSNSPTDWGVALYIGDSDKAARLWALGKGTEGITGTTCIQGLKWAMETVAWIANRLPVECTLVIEGEDDRRTTLYCKMVDKQMKLFEQNDLRMCKVKYLRILEEQ